MAGPSLPQSEEEKAKEAYIQERMRHFSKFGLLVYDDALLTCAQIASRKTYEFKPTILKGLKDIEAMSDLHQLYEIKEYLQTLKWYFDNHHLPVRERFLIIGKHWITGDIQIDESGRVHAFLLDSLGLEGPGSSTDTVGSTSAVVTEISSVFPDAFVFCAFALRQATDEPICHFIALDDLRHLHTVEEHLPPEFRETGLFGYLSQQIPPGEGDEVRARDGSRLQMHDGSYPVRWPLPFIRMTLGSRRFIDMLKQYSESELAVPIDKRGRQLRSNTLPEFFRSEQGGKTYNMRIIDALRKFAKFNQEYLRSTEPKIVEEAMLQFTLQGFQQRIAPKYPHTLHSFYDRVKLAIKIYKDDFWKSKESKELSAELNSLVERGASEQEIKERIVAFIETKLPKDGVKGNRLIGYLIDLGLIDFDKIRIENVTPGSRDQHYGARLSTHHAALHGKPPASARKEGEEENKLTPPPPGDPAPKAP